MGAQIAPLRVVLDSNVLISALLFGGRVGELHAHWRAGRIVPLVSKATFAELRRVLAYPKFRLTPAEIVLLVEEEFLPWAEVVEVPPSADPPRCRDPHDEKFLHLAAAGRADCLVTGDADLLVLQRHGKTAIITVNVFLERLAGK